MAEFHVHPNNPNEIVYGERLKVGDIIGSGDVYDSCRGIWKKSPLTDLPIKNDRFYWVRPVKQEK